MSTPDTNLNVVEQRDVVFYDDELSAVRAADGQVYVSIRQLCAALGVDPQGQTQRIRRHAVLADGERVCKLHTPQGMQSAIVLRVDLVPLWLSGIRTSAVREEIRPKLDRFQREAAKVLWNAFKEGQLTTETTLDALAAADTPEARAFLMARAIYDMARQQLLMSNRLETQGRAIEQNSLRIEALEAQLGQSDRYIDDRQAMEISQAVKAIAIELGGRSGRNEFGGVYGELYRRFGVTSYLKLPAARFGEALDFLRQWYQGVTAGDDAPF